MTFFFNFNVFHNGKAPKITFIVNTDDIICQYELYFFVIPKCLNRESRVFNIFWIPGQARNDVQASSDANFIKKFVGVLVIKRKKYYTFASFY